jgi:hypothetical protein
MKNRLLVLASLALSLGLGYAQEAPTGSIIYNFTAANFPIWNFSGPYGFSQQMAGVGGPVPLGYSLTINHTLEGQLTGAGATIVTLGQDVAAAQYVVKGTVSQGGDATRVAFTVSLTGSGLDYIGGQRHSFHISLSYSLMVDPASLTLVPIGNGPGVRGSVQIAGLGNATVIPGEGFAVALPPGVDGAWGVSLDVVGLDQLGGTATIAMDSAAPGYRPIYLPATLSLTANLTGSFRAPLNLSAIRLTGLPGSTPATLDLNIVNGQPQFLLVKGSILGQTVSFSGNFQSE